MLNYKTTIITTKNILVTYGVGIIIHNLTKRLFAIGEWRTDWERHHRLCLSFERRLLRMALIIKSINDG